MDFDKLNAMMDELNSTFGIIEENTKALENDKLERNKEYFYNVHEYFANWARLFKKTLVSPHMGTFFIKPNADSNTSIKISIGEQYANIRYGHSTGRLTEIEDVMLIMYNKNWFNRYYFKDDRFERIVLPTIRSIDYDYIEKVLMEKLNEAITRKAEKIEAEYNKAIQNA